MKEQLISYETVKLAKEKGFKPNKRDNSVSRNSIDITPTQSLLQRWLREVHKIHIGGEVRWNSFEKQELIYEFWIKDMRKVKTSKRIHTYPSIISYEEALECGLLEALKLISYENL